jgi:hypothetical protein
VQSGPKEFTACYEDEVRNWRVYFELNGEGEEHEIRMLLQWQNQVLLVREAFGCDMVLDESKPAEN